MSLISEIKEAFNFIKAIKEVKKFLDSTKLTENIKEHVEAIKYHAEELAKSCKAIGTIIEIFKKAIKK